MKNYNSILAEKQQKQWQYHQVKLTNLNILLPRQKIVIQKANFTCSPLPKAFEEQIKTTEDQTS